MRGHPQVNIRRSETIRHYAYDGVAFAAQHQPFADHASVAMITALPKSEIDHRRQRTSELFFVSMENPPNHCRRFKNREISRGNPSSGQPFRLTAAGIGDIFRIRARNHLEALAEPVPILDSRRSHQTGVLIFRRIRLQHRYQKLGIRIRQGLPQHCVDERKKSSCGSDPQRQYQDSCRGECRPPAERPAGGFPVRHICWTTMPTPWLGAG